MYDGTMWAGIDSLIPKCIKAIDIETPDNIKWVATPIGISHSTSQGTWVLLNGTNSGFPNDNFLSIALDNNSAVWAGTDAEGTIVKIENSTIEIYNAQNSDALGAVGAINCIAVDRDNGIYFGTDNEGLVKLRILSGN
jgi:ligand-binding sensor domain-containing protein